MSSDIWDDDGWEDMPVIRSSATEATTSVFDLADEEDARKRSRYAHAPTRVADSPLAPGVGFSSIAGGAGSGNATGRLVNTDDQRGTGLREKDDLDEMDYTRLELDDDPEEDEISMRTQYLFNEDTSMTPLSQMQQTKTMLSEGQRIAYVGLSRLVVREMVQTLALAAKGAKELEPARESCQNWANKIMGRLYRHMDLAEHGVTAEDLTPSLVATYTVDNPDYDPEAADIAAQEAAEADITFESEERAKQDGAEKAQENGRRDVEAEERKELHDKLGSLALRQEEEAEEEPQGYVKREVKKIERRTSEAAYDSFASPTRSPSPRSPTARSPHAMSPQPRSRTKPSAFDAFDGGDIGSALDEPPTPKSSKKSHQPDDFLSALPSSLPGVSKTLTAADKTVTLDIRWTILCDLFLALIADSVYDARSRVLLGKMADKLGLEWNDVVRFERRLTEALEIQEAVKDKEHQEVLEGRRQKDKRTRYMMMGLATVGGGLVIGLSAGLLAPVIGAGLGAALTTIGVTGTSSFLAGAGGAAIISSGATLTGSVIGGKAMAKRTQHVKTFDIQPLHNNKRLNFFITVPGFMNGPRDDVRLPFSTIDPVMGDVLSVCWEPEMMGATGNALKILTSEVLTQAGQQVLAATVMTALMSALQWPMMLTKLSYLIDNPWSNSLDRARQAGAVLADILLNRRLGVRPVSLVGFSLGARVIFFALVELAKANAFGVVQEVYLFGATVTASKKVWRQVRGIVSGRFVNGYAMNDWVLGYLFRATTGGLQTVAGLRPIEHVPEIENVDVTHLLEGHLSYRTMMPKLLAYVGFKTTADHFDEPDQDPDAPEREVLTKEEEERRALEKEKRERKGLGIFKRKKAASSQSMSRDASLDEYDLPPRMSASSSRSSLSPQGISSQGGQSPSSLSIASAAAESEVSKDEKAEEKGLAASVESPLGESGEASSPAISQADPNEASSPAMSQADPNSFDLEKLRAEVAQLPKPSPERSASLPPADIPVASAAADITRTPSAPPPTEPPQTDLTYLDQTLDPQELLRRQWNGEALPSDAASPPAPPAESAWGASSLSLSLPDDHYASSFSFPSSSWSVDAERPSFTFADTNGFVDSASSSQADDLPTFTFGNGADVSAWGASESSSGSKATTSTALDDAPDPAASFVWGNKTAASSTSTFATRNPW
ncbi:SPOSA6832_03683 [Sporobolomyces salmonicolor]|uniref:SPOSA6832_03683-mRNA-1:cds n=1 Tax=Sporidiobolus salmonicolor TaxID=5005 RepID=A0A0D6EQT7_SPOSA|nr:SPOSA6832_03683 [Sporobolomyces salmonicolor]